MMMPPYFVDIHYQRSIPLTTPPSTTTTHGENNSTGFPSNSSMVSTSDNDYIKLLTSVPDLNFINVPNMADFITTTTEPRWIGVSVTTWLTLLAVLGIVIFAFCVFVLICCCCFKIADDEREKNRAAKRRKQNDAIQQAAAVAAQTAKNQAPPFQQPALPPVKPAERAPDVIKTETVIERDTKTLPDGRQFQSVKITKTSSEKSHHESQLPPPVTSQRQESIVQVDPSSRHQQSIIQIDNLPVATPVYTPVYTPAYTPVYTPVYQPTPYPPQPSQLQPQPESYSQQSSSQQ